MRLRRIAAISSILLAAIAFLATVVTYMPQAQAQSDPASPAPATSDLNRSLQTAPSSPVEPITAGIRATDRISIPYGFQSTLPLIDDGQTVIARGHGGCTAGQQFTVDVTVTQGAYGVIGAGQTTGTCDGQLQTWHAMVQAYPGSSFSSGPAESCGTATTSDDGAQTDVFEWCKDVVLDPLDNELYLPITAALPH